jgi:hypothetical protein
MPILQAKDREAVTQRFNVELKRDVSLELYTQRSIGGLYVPGRECRTCGPTQQMMEELAALSPRLNLEVKDFYGDPEQARARDVETIPATLIGSGGSYNARFYGLPSGYEFAVLLDSIIAASQSRPALALESRRLLKQLAQDVHIRVFVTPT